MIMSSTYKERETVSVNGIEYLIDRDKRTAWIGKTPIQGSVELTLPESVTIDGIRYTCTDVEWGAFDDEPNLAVLNIPDSYTYIDEYAFRTCKKLHTVNIGSGLKHFHPCSFYGCPLKSVTISAENSFLKMSDDGNLVLSKNGKTLYSVIDKENLDDLTIQEGVKEIYSQALSGCSFRNISFPSTLRKIVSNAINECSNIGHLIIPEGVTEIGHQGLERLENLIVLDLPSTLKHYSFQMLSGDVRLSFLILRSNSIVELETVERFDSFLDTPVGSITLLVPAHLVTAYKEHPQWSRFRTIQAIDQTI